MPDACHRLHQGAVVTRCFRDIKGEDRNTREFRICIWLICDYTFMTRNLYSHEISSTNQIPFPTQPKTPQTCCKLSILQLVNKSQQAGQFHRVATSLLKSSLLQLVICRLVSTICWNNLQQACGFDNKFGQSTFNKLVTTCNRLAASHANASWYQLTVTSCCKMSIVCFCMSWNYNPNRVFCWHILSLILLI